MSSTDIKENRYGYSSSKNSTGSNTKQKIFIKLFLGKVISQSRKAAFKVTTNPVGPL